MSINVQPASNSINDRKTVQKILTETVNSGQTNIRSLGQTSLISSGNMTQRRIPLSEQIERAKNAQINNNEDDFQDQTSKRLSLSKVKPVSSVDNDEDLDIKRKLSYGRMSKQSQRKIPEIMDDDDMELTQSEMLSMPSRRLSGPTLSQRLKMNTPSSETMNDDVMSSRRLSNGSTLSQRLQMNTPPQSAMSPPKTPMLRRSSMQPSLSQRLEQTRKTMQSNTNKTYSLADKLKTRKSLTDETVETVSKVEIANIDAFEGNDKDVKVLKPYYKKAESAISYYEEQLAAVGVTVISKTNFSKTNKMLLLKCISKKGTVFYVEVSTFNSQALYIPQTEMTLTKYEGTEFELSNKISLEECKNLSTCDVVYSCNDEFCVLRHQNNSFKKEEFVIASQEKSNKSIHVSGHIIARPLVTYDSIITKPEEILVQVEQSAMNLLMTATKNAQLEAILGVRNSFRVVFDQLEIKNVFDKMMEVLTLEELQRLNEISQTENSDQIKILTDRIVATKEAREELLNAFSKFNADSKILNTYFAMIEKISSDMKNVAKTYMLADSDFMSDQFWENLKIKFEFILAGPSTGTITLE